MTTIPTRSYKDLDLDLTVHPNTGDLVYLKDAAAIKRSIKNLILTMIYERHFNDTYGSLVYNMLFNPMSYFTAVSISRSIEAAISMYEPRAKLIEVLVVPDAQEQGYEISISFNILNRTESLQEIKLFLERIK